MGASARARRLTAFRARAVALLSGHVGALWLVWLSIVGGIYIVGHVALDANGLRSVPEGFEPRGVFDRWDVLNYHRIGIHGYENSPRYHLAWFPGLPLLIRLCAEVGLTPLRSANLVAVGSSFLLVPVFYELARCDFSDAVAKHATTLLLVFPSSFFLYVGYTEAPFMLLVAASFLCARRQLWLPAALFAGAASGFRVAGVLLTPALLIEYSNSVDWDIRRVRANIAWLALAPVGLFAYMAYLWRDFGDPLAFQHQQESSWGRSLGPDTLDRLRDELEIVLTDVPIEAKFPLLVGALGVAFFAALLPAMIHFRVRISYVVFSVLAVAMPLLTGTLVSMNRYILAAFPMFLVLGKLTNRYPSTHLPLVVGCSLLLALSASRFATYYWVG